MVNTKEERAKSLESKLKNLIEKKGAKTEIENSKKNIKPEKTSIETAEENEPEQVVEKKSHLNFPNSVSEFKNSNNFRPEVLGLDEPIVANPGGRLENDLRSIPQDTPIVKDEHRKSEEVYQTAKLMYDESERQRRVDVGREVMQARVTSPLMTNPTMGIGTGRRVDMINPSPETGGDEGEKVYQTQNRKESRQRMPWEVGETEQRKYN